jgi:hypothetical protein
MTITTLPAAPSRADPTNFATKADALLGALAGFVTETNATGVDVTTKSQQAVTSAVTASDAASSASASSVSALASAASAANAPGTNASSVTSLPLTIGTKSLTIQTNKAFAIGQSIVIANVTTPTLQMLGVITVFDTSTGALTVSVSTVFGTGTFANWVVALSANTTNFVTVDAVQTLTNKTITETVFAVTGTTPALNATNGAVQTWTLTAASTPTSSLVSGGSIILIITPGAYAITWPAGTLWTKQGGSGAAPTLFSAGKTTVILWKVSSTLYGSHLGDTV